MRCTTILLCSLWCAQTVSSQAYTAWAVEGGAPAALHGKSVAVAGDLNGDTVPDIVVGSPGATVGLLTWAGEIRVLSGVDGSVLLSRSGSSAGDGYGYSVAGLGDVNGDLVPDFAVGAPQAFTGNPFGGGNGFVDVVSGATGAVIWSGSGTNREDQLGWSVAALGDLDGDNVSDLAVGAPRDYSCINPPCPSVPGQVQVRSGANGSVLFTLTGQFQQSDLFGWSVSGAGDWNGDGTPDLIVGAPHQNYVQVFSGASGIALFAASGFAAVDQFGYSVAAVGDLDGNGVTEVAIGAPLADPGYVWILDGGTGALRYALTGAGPQAEQFGAAVTAAGDADGDGTPDVLVGAPQVPVSGYPWANGYLQCFSGVNGGSILRVDGTIVGSQFGAALASAGDLDGDGFPEWIVGAPGGGVSNGSFPGAATRLSPVGLAPGSVRYGPGCPGSLGIIPRISQFGGLPLPGNDDFGIVLSKAVGNTQGVLFLGVSPASIQLTFLGLPSCFLNVSGELAVPIATSGAGASRVALPLPNNPNLAAQSLFFQFYVFDPGPGIVPASLTAGLRVLFL